jgi:aspartyl-tRNA synthetase
LLQKIQKINQEVFLIILINGQKNKVLQVLAYFTIEKDKEISAKGPVGKFFSKESLEEIMKKTGAEVGDSIFLACGKKKN